MLCDLYVTTLLLMLTLHLILVDGIKHVPGVQKENKKQ